MARVRTWTAVVFLFIFADAVAMQARGPILSSLEGAFGVSEAVLRLVASARTIGFLVAVGVLGIVAVLWLWTGTADVPTTEPIAD